MLARTFRLLLVVALMQAGAASAQMRVADIPFAAAETLDGATLSLNGAGLRTRMLFKVYAMGLYLANASTDGGQIVAAPPPKRIRIVLVRDLEARQFTDALADGLERNHDAATLAALEPAATALTKLILARGKAPSGTEILLDQLGDGATRLSIDGEVQGAPITDAALYPALLRIWLGERPADSGLKAALLKHQP